MPPEYGYSGTYPGDLLSFRVESLAPESLFGRLLDHADKIGLTEAQRDRFHRLSRGYHEKHLALRLEFTALGEKVRLTPQPLTAAAITARNKALQRRAELFGQTEHLYFEYQARAGAVFDRTDQQRLVTVFLDERQQVLGGLQAALTAAVAPTYTLARADGTDDVPAGEGRPASTADPDPDPDELDPGEPDEMDEMAEPAFVD